MESPGRACPLDYRYSPGALARVPAIRSQTLFVVGGLYGNVPALRAISRLAARESVAPVIVFNGDFNWFNVDPGSFLAVNETVLRHHALRGNVETELAPERGGAGCGCGYPEWVPQGVVERSNQIMERLRECAAEFPDLVARLSALPMHLAAEVAGERIVIVHGDLESLAGWGLAAEAVDGPGAREALGEAFGIADARIVACSHTCLPVLRRVDLAGGEGVLVNNGAAGMPNFRDTRYGVITRIGAEPAPSGDALYGARVGGAVVEALRVDYDHPEWIESFLANWPPGSPAHESYFGRIQCGPCYEVRQAAGLERAGEDLMCSTAAG